jgi:hypothetical protein
MLDHEEYIEQAYFFRVLEERQREENVILQDLLLSVREEILSTTRLPMAIDFIATELKHMGVFAPALKRMGHYFTPFQAFVVEEAERERGRFDLRVALQILQREADYRSKSFAPQGLFLYQFECLCRNRLRYDPGLAAIADDPFYDAAWKEWILSVRRRIGMVEIADLIFIRSEYYETAHRLSEPRRDYAMDSNEEEDDPDSDEAAQVPDLPEALESEPPEPLFGDREGRIALANRKKDPLLLFAAMQRQLGYPAAPRPKPVENREDQLGGLARQVERMERRIKLLEEEQKGGIDLTKFFGPPKEGGAEIAE